MADRPALRRTLREQTRSLDGSRYNGGNLRRLEVWTAVATTEGTSATRKSGRQSLQRREPPQRAALDGSRYNGGNLRNALPTCSRSVSPWEKQTRCRLVRAASPLGRSSWRAISNRPVFLERTGVGLHPSFCSVRKNLREFKLFFIQLAYLCK